MNQTIRVIRDLGARNVVIADGPGVGQVIDGAPLLDDGQVAYASHPYALKPAGQARLAWDANFGTFSRRAPVIITEWLSGVYFCNADTPASTVEFLRDLQQHRIGLQAEYGTGHPLPSAARAGDFPLRRFLPSLVEDAIKQDMEWELSSRAGTPAEFRRLRPSNRLPHKASCDFRRCSEGQVTATLGSV